MFHSKRTSVAESTVEDGGGHGQGEINLLTAITLFVHYSYHSTFLKRLSESKS